MGELPKKSDTRVLIETLAVASVSLIPIVGGSFSIVFQETMGRAYGKRRDKWLEELSTSLEFLINLVDGLNLDNLAENENFLDALSTATLIVNRSHQQEKITALRNAVLNSALADSPDADKQSMFLQYIAELTPSHMQLLSLFDNAKEYFRREDIEWVEVMMGGRSHLVEKAFPSWTRDFYNQLTRQLRSNGLIVIDNLHITQSGAGLSDSVTSPFGKEFIHFISEPILD